jgi:hypothetical protein
MNNNCHLYISFPFLEYTLSKLEGYLSNKTEIKWNNLLLTICSAWLAFTVLFISISQVIIKISFNGKNILSGVKYKNIASFNNLCIILCMFCVILAYFSLKYYWKSNNVITPIPFIVSFIGNSSLLFYFQTNALEYWNLKVKQMTEKRRLEKELRLNRTKIQVFAPRIIEDMNIERCAPIQSISVNRDQTVYVIDLEESEQ